MLPVIKRLKKWTKDKMSMDTPGPRKWRRFSTSTRDSCPSATDFPRPLPLGSEAAEINPSRHDSNISPSTDTETISQVQSQSSVGGSWILVPSYQGEPQAMGVDNGSPIWSSTKMWAQEVLMESEGQPEPATFEERAPVENEQAYTATEQNPAADGQSKATEGVGDADTEDLFESQSTKALSGVLLSESTTASIPDESLMEETSTPIVEKERAGKSRLDALTLDENPEAVKALFQVLVSKKDDWDKLRLHRKNVLSLRFLLQTQRTVLRDIETAKEDADNTFMKHTKKNSPTQDPVSEEERKAFEDSFSELQKTRNDYGPALVECMQREKALDIVEWEIGRIEDLIYSTLFGEIPDDTNLASAFAHTEAAVASASAPSPWLGLVAGVQERYQPLPTMYLSRLGDMDLARERLENLQREEEDLLSRKEYLLHLGQELNVDSKEMLKDIPLREAELQNEIADLRREIADMNVDILRLRQECIDAGIDPDGLDVDADGRSDDGSGHSLSLYEGDV